MADSSSISTVKITFIKVPREKVSGVLGAILWEGNKLPMLQKIHRGQKIEYITTTN